MPLSFPLHSPGKSFREEQCEKYNRPVHFDFHGNAKQWIPKYTGVSPRDRCKLVCRAQGSSEFRVFEAKVSISVHSALMTTSLGWGLNQLLPQMKLHLGEVLTAVCSWM